MTTETLDRPAVIGEELERVERQLQENDAALGDAFTAAREVNMAAWRGDDGAEARRQELDSEVAELRADRERLEAIRADLSTERTEAAAAARLGKFDTERAELMAECVEAAEAAEAVDAGLNQLIGALERWDKADTMRISRAGRLGLPTFGLMRSGQTLPAFLKTRLGRYLGEHAEPAYRRAFKNGGWVEVDATWTRVAEQDVDRARKKLT